MRKSVTRVMLACSGLMIPWAAQAQTGGISGTVGFEGTPPARRHLEVTADNDVCGDTVMANDLVINDGAVAYAVVWVEGAEGQVGAEQYKLSNTQCHFVPPVMAGTVGGTLIIENTDPVLHNTHLKLQFKRRGRTVANVALPVAGLTIENNRALRRPGLIDVSCDAHTWMHSKIWVFDHPYYAVTGEDGSFQIGDLEPGTYVVKVWHEVLGEREREVTVAADQVSGVDFGYGPSAMSGASR